MPATTPITAAVFAARHDHRFGQCALTLPLHALRVEGAEDHRDHPEGRTIADARSDEQTEERGQEQSEVFDLQ